MSNSAAACNLADKKCVPCEGGVPPLTQAQWQGMLAEIPSWEVRDGIVLIREFTFKNFSTALAFVNRLGGLAEKEGHHPDIFLHDWNQVRVSCSTHAIGGLSENDFILAAKIDSL